MKSGFVAFRQKNAETARHFPQTPRVVATIIFMAILAWIVDQSKVTVRGTVGA
jgi:hypothetical protein